MNVSMCSHLLCLTVPAQKPHSWHVQTVIYKHHNNIIGGVLAQPFYYICKTDRRSRNCVGARVWVCYEKAGGATEQSFMKICQLVQRSKETKVHKQTDKQKMATW